MPQEGNAMAKKSPPKTLGDAGRLLWSAVSDKYELRPDETHVLEAACLAEDRATQMRAELASRSLVTAGSMGQEVVHPLVAEIRAHEAQVATLLGKLKLPDEDGGAGVNHQRTGGETRWANAHGAGA